MHRNDDGDFDGRRDKAGNRLLQATLAISILLGFTFEVLKEGLSHETGEGKGEATKTPLGLAAIVWTAVWTKLVDQSCLAKFLQTHRSIPIHVS